MRGLQGSFPPCKRRLHNGNAKEQKLVITSIVLIHNFRTVFDTEYEMYMSLMGYERIRSYYFNEDNV
jgi:hypothetical protein